LRRWIALILLRGVKDVQLEGELPLEPLLPERAVEA